MCYWKASTDRDTDTIIGLILDWSDYFRPLAGLLGGVVYSDLFRLL